MTPLTEEQIKRERAKKVRSLSCCCCGGWIERGRQWHNRDTGYGMCVLCIAYVRKKGMGQAEIEDLYGLEDVHWGLEL